jgi:hypothetical protein
MIGIALFIMKVANNNSSWMKQREKFEKLNQEVIMFPY